MLYEEQQEELLKKVREEINNSNQIITEKQIEYWTSDNLPEGDLRLRKIKVDLIKNNPYNWPSMILPFLFGAFGTALVFYLMWALSVDNYAVNNKEAVPLIFILLYGFQLMCILGLLSIKKQLDPFLFRSAINKESDALGQIVCYCKTSYDSHNDTERNNYYLVIKYKDYKTGEDKLFMTPRLSFIPEYALGSLNCKVYEYKNKAFAYDFETPADCNQMVTILEDNHYLKDPKVCKNSGNKALLIVIAVLCFIIDLAILYNNLRLFW